MIIPTQPLTTVAECVFNTSLTGYQEILTDPSYKGQFVVFTYPHIGNVGINLGKKRGACAPDSISFHSNLHPQPCVSWRACASGIFSLSTPK